MADVNLTPEEREAIIRDVKAYFGEDVSADFLRGYAKGSRDTVAMFQGDLELTVEALDMMDAHIKSAYGA